MVFIDKFCWTNEGVWSTIDEKIGFWTRVVSIHLKEARERIYKKAIREHYLSIYTIKVFNMMKFKKMPLTGTNGYDGMKIGSKVKSIMKDSFFDNVSIKYLQL